MYGERVIFQQDGCLFPADWSDTACTIVASKYFYGEQNTPARETSLNQLVSRIVDTITDWGIKDGYFADSQSADTFRNELSYLLLHQYGAFNSPVWFNVGIYQNYGVKGGTGNWRWTPDGAVQCGNYEYPQVSACFIQGVDDTMDSIMQLAYNDAMLFKYGSGTGSDLSHIRSSREKLQGGGKPSGVLSFLRIFDTTANVVKSGGKSRRAALLHSLHADHLDIEDFITCKQKEEQKAQALIQQGFTPEEAYDTVAFQNVNLSVRCSDKFMHAVESDSSWTLTPVTVDPIAKRELPAKELWNLICQSAHASGEPGLQFHDVINRWNTIPHEGIIESSNPCATYSTKILTNEGYKQIGELEGRDDVFLIKPDGNISKGKVWKTGKKQVVQLILTTCDKKTNGHNIIKVTPDHLFRVINGNDTQAIDLCGKKLFPMLSEIPQTELEFVKYGFIQGDGVLTRLDRIKYPHHQSVDVCIGKKDDDILGLFGFTQKTKRQQYRVGIEITEKLLELGFVPARTYNRVFPLTYSKWTLNQKRAFLKGVYSANGSINGNYFVSYKTSSKLFAEQLIEALYEFGIVARLQINKKHDVLFSNGSYSCKESYNVAINRFDSLSLFSIYINFVQRYKKDALQKLLIKRAPQVTSVQPCGEEDVYDFSEPDEHYGVVEGVVVHNCSEFMSVNNTACNLASLNLLKFYDTSTGIFDVDKFQSAVRLFIIAQDILVDNGSYPTKEIAENSHKYRPLGLGYTNLGALLMCMGIPYDSDAGRNVCAGITALMTGTAYAVSAELAEDLAPFDAYAANKDAMTQIIARHRTYHEHLNLTGNIYDAGKRVWAKDAKYGYRNSQVTVLAPTGTISFMMDAQTTGIEPELSLVKYKNLSGGGTLKLVNKCIEPALRRLGFSESSISDTLDYFAKYDKFPPNLLTDAQRKVFQTALSDTDGIAWKGHIDMMAAAQRFLSGAISKTVNLPHNATVQDVSDVYLHAYKTGVKSITVYRDGCKQLQPLVIKKEEQPKSSSVSDGQFIIPTIESRRIPLPDTRIGVTHKFTVGGYEGYFTLGFYENGKIGELFITISKEGSTLAGMMDCFGTLVSVALQYGVPIDALEDKFCNTRFEPAGLTGNTDIPIASSIIDYIFQWIRNWRTKGNNIAVHSVQAECNTHQESANIIGDTPICTVCGTFTQRSGTCYLCSNCGTTTGCG
jgi:ribonucleoside-diphosphate reductase alpha chain